MFRCTCLALGILGGCAHYSLADAAQTVAVRTVSTPPHLNLNEGDLTRKLVADLRTRGYDARWADQANLVLTCKLETSRPLETDDAAMFELSGTCDWSGTNTPQHVGTQITSIQKTSGADFAGAADRAATQLLAELAHHFDRAQERNP